MRKLYRMAIFMDLLSSFTADVNSLSPLVLAFVGDTVYDLLVRESLVAMGNRPVKKLHGEAVAFVKAEAQSRGAKKIFDLLTEEEQAVLKRGRNARTNHLPKNACVEDYHYATGLEALFGYLYLKGRNDRIKTLFELINSDYIKFSNGGASNEKN